MSAVEFTNEDPRFEFVDSIPPASNGGNGKYVEFAEAVRANPNRWALWPSKLKNRNTAHATAAQVNRGAMKNFPKGEFQAAARDGVVYVRFVGGVA